MTSGESHRASAPGLEAFARGTRMGWARPVAKLSIDNLDVDSTRGRQYLRIAGWAIFF